MIKALKDGVYYVLDTSSVIRVREVIPQSHRKTVFSKLTDYVEDQILVYPKEVLNELEKGSNDAPYAWAKENSHTATRFGPLFEAVREVMAHPQACRVLDPNKNGTIEADPHVLALALHLRQVGASPIVINNETKTRPNKLALTEACGSLRLVAQTMEVFLEQQGIWKK